MTMQYLAKNGSMQYKPAFSWLSDIVDSDNSSGFCLACGEENDGIEPDARKYTCDCCNAAKVYGAETLILMGLFYED